MTHLSPRSSHVEVLESRIALSATPLSVGRALDLDESVSVVLSGNGLSFATQSLGATGQLLGFPSGGDGDFLILSTGIASHVTTVENTGDSQGTDLGPEGAEGDTATVKFTLQVPQGASAQRLKIDFMFLTEEYPEFVGSELFNDTFEILINGVNYAQDEEGNPIEVDNAFFNGAPAPGTFFDGRTNKLTLTYVVPDGMTTLDIELRLSDVGDGELDSAVLVDNVRFETPQLVYLDFDGGPVTDLFGSGITALIPGFSAADIGSMETTDALIAQLVAKLQEKFSLYDVAFTTTLPTEGDFTTLFVGGDNDLLLDISSASPLLQRQHPGASVALSDLFGLGPDSLLGFAGAPDVGNFNRNDQAVIFSGEFDDFFASLTPEERLEHLAVTLAHELGHNLGLRHLDDTATADIMKQTAPRAIDATFGSTLLNLAEEWSDGVTTQNDHSYLSSILGRANATGLAATAVQSTVSFSTQGVDTLFDVTLTITGSDPDAAPITLRFDQLDGSQNIPLPNLPLGAKITITASSQDGGPVDIFSGRPMGGEITNEASAVPLFGANGNLLAIPLSKGAPGSLSAHGSLPLFANELGDVTVLPNKTGTFTDSDGDVYTVKLSGPGIMGYVLNDPDQDGRGGLQRLVLDDTTVGESVLSITVKKSATGDGRVNFGEITGSIGAGLKALNAPAISFNAGGVVFSGALASVTVRDFTDGADLIGGVGAGIKTNVTLHHLGDGSDVAFGTDVAVFKAARIGDSGLTMASLAKLTVTGDRAANLAGDIAGQFTIAGLLGSVSARDLLPTAIIEAGGTALDRTVLALHEIMNGAVISLASVVSSLKAARVGDADISAQQFDSITISGDSRNFIPGDFGADLTAINKIGKFKARDILGTAEIIAGGLVFDKTSFTAHAILDGVNITLESSVSTFKAAYVGFATIQVAAIASLQITGDSNAWLSGDFLGTLILTGGDEFFVNTLGNAKFAGNLIDASISAETIGTFNAKGMFGSNVFAGFTPADAENPWDGGVFFEGGTIKSFTVGKNGFSDSVVAAKSIGTISVGALWPANGGESFGFLMKAAPTRVSVTGFSYVKNGPADQMLADFHVKVV
jgi:hypothetical protein